jgi:hypothetical protein
MKLNGWHEVIKKTWVWSWEKIDMDASHALRTVAVNLDRWDKNVIGISIKETNIGGLCEGGCVEGESEEGDEA